MHRPATLYARHTRLLSAPHPCVNVAASISAMTFPLKSRSFRARAEGCRPPSEVDDRAASLLSVRSRCHRDLAFDTNPLGSAVSCYGARREIFSGIGRYSVVSKEVFSGIEKDIYGIERGIEWYRESYLVVSREIFRGIVRY